MSLLDRDELLARTDLAELITEICGPSQGGGRSARWHCANPDHPDNHPSMGVYTGPKGQRWKCHACGAGGTAIDLLMIAGSVGAGEAMHDLARRLGLDADPSRPMVVRPVPMSRRPVSESAPNRASSAHPAVEDLVAAAERLLREPAGRLARRVLTERGFSDAILQANRVGFDPGPGRLPRPDGLPRSSPGIVYPVLDQNTGRAIYYQVRTLSPNQVARRKYDQPTVELAPNPKLAVLRTPQPITPSVVAITEGIPDGLTIAEAGLTAGAVLGVSHAAPDAVDALAELILEHVPAAGYAVCFDPDERGRPAGTRLANQLAQHGVHVANILPPEGIRDLNVWWQSDRRSLVRELTGTVPTLGF